MPLIDKLIKYPDCSIDLQHEVRDGILTVNVRCEAISGKNSKISVVATILRFLTQVARMIVQQREAFELASIENGTVVDLGITAFARTTDQPPTVYLHRTSKD